MARGTVYRAFDSQERLLYVGTTVTPNRLRDHASIAPWWSLTVRIELTHFATATEATEAEADAIYTKQPLFNRSNNRVWDLRWHAIEEKRLAGQTWPSIAGDLDMSTRRLTALVVRRRRAGKSRV